MFKVILRYADDNIMYRGALKTNFGKPGKKSIYFFLTRFGLRVLLVSLLGLMNSGWCCASDVTSSSSSKDALLDKLIRIEKTGLANSEVSSKFVDAIKTGLQAYPQPILSLLANIKYEVHLGNLVTTCLPKVRCNQNLLGNTATG